MTDAKPSLLRPDLNGGASRPSELAKGNYALQSRAAVLSMWWPSVGSNSNSTIPPFGASVGTPLHMDWDSAVYNMLGLQCLGDPTAMDDRSVVQTTKLTTPTVGAVLAPYMWFDWVHMVPARANAVGTLMVGKGSGNYAGAITKLGFTRAIFPLTGVFAANGSTQLESVPTWTTITAGNIGSAAYDAPLISEDGTTPAPLQLRLPCYVHRYGYLGQAGQVLTSPSSDAVTTKVHGAWLRPQLWRNDFVANVPSKKLEFSPATADYGAEVFGALGYTMEYYDAPQTFMQLTGSPAVCTVELQRCVRTMVHISYVNVRLLLVGNTYMLIMSIHQMKCVAAPSGIYYRWSTFWGGGAPVSTPTPVYTTSPVVSVNTVVGYNTTTTLNQSMFDGLATMTATIVVAAGKITQCDIAAVPSQPIVTSGQGWRDVFFKI